MRKLILSLGLLLGFSGSLWAGPIQPSAATMHLVCNDPCWFGGTSLVTYGSSPVEFDMVSQDGVISGWASLGILVPNDPVSFSVSEGYLEYLGTFSSGKLGELFGIPGLTDFEFSAIRSAAAQAGVTADTFSASNWYLGPYSSTGSGALGLAGLGIYGVPPGTVIVGWLEDANGNAIERTPLSESITAGQVPEPGTLLLFGSGLILIGRKIRAIV